MDAELTGYILYLVGLLTFAGIYSVMTLGLNVHWGMTGLFNAGIVGFMAVGAYASVILTSPASPNFLGGFGLPFPLGPLAAMLFSGLIALPIGLITIRLKSDYLAIGTIGIAEILRLFFKNEQWLGNGVRGIAEVAQPFSELSNVSRQFAFLVMIAAIVLLIYWLLQRASKSPWGRMMRAIRDNEVTAEAMGKDVNRRRLEAFVVGAMLMGLGGALYAHFNGFIGSNSLEPVNTTFLVWVMLIAGGSGNNKGAIIGAVVVWTIWSLMQFVSNYLPPEWQIRAAYIRFFLVGLLLQVVLQRFAGGLIPERRVAKVKRRRSA
jgi:branched-chain amino acid transport system permease protein